MPEKSFYAPFTISSEQIDSVAIGQCYSLMGLHSGAEDGSEKMFGRLKLSLYCFLLAQEIRMSK